MIEIGARRHGPVPAVFRIPAEWQLDQGSARRTVQISSRVIARSQNVIHPHLFNVRLPAIETGLPAALIPDSIPLKHRKMSIRKVMVKIALREIFQPDLRRGPCERSPHAGLRIGLRNLGMARG